MAQVKVLATGQVLDVDNTDYTALDYYRRQPADFELIGDPAPPVVAEVVVEGGSTEPERPALSALKPEWVDYALAVDPGNAAGINEMTKDELVDNYGE
jgi:hypothetical protein